MGPLAVRVLPLLLSGCAPLGEDLPSYGQHTDSGAALILDLAVEQSAAVPTVATVTFSTAEPMVARAWLQPPGLPEVPLALPDVPQTAHRFALVGAPEGLISTFRIEVEGDGQLGQSDLVPFDAGLFDPDLRRPEVDAAGPSAFGEGYLLAVVLSADRRNTPVVLDAAGRLVWALADGERIGHRMRLLPGGAGVAWQTVTPGSDVGGVQAVAFDGTPLWWAGGPMVHQDFDMIAPDRALMLGYELVEVSTPDGPLSLWSDRVVALQPDSPPQEIWRLLDDLDYEEHQDQFAAAENGGAIDWAHVNYIDAHDDGLVYLTALALDAGLVLDPEAGTLQATVGMRDGPGTPPSVALDAPHSLWPTDDGLLVFQQRSGGADGQCGVVQRLAGLDGPAETLPLDGDCFHTSFLGNAQALPDGSVLVGWAEEGIIQRRSWQGEVLGELILPIGTAFGYTEWLPDLGG